MIESTPQKFLSEKEVDYLTGVARGTGGRSKFEIQCEHLRKKGIQFWDDARGRPIVSGVTN